jgi:glycosyltransferase involved in cell wall biosynthesis
MKISVVTVCYNSEKTIAATLESVLAQTHGETEYIIIDGASKDRTVKIAESYQEHFAAKGFEYRIVSEPDKGIYDAMNKGIAMAAGELVGIVNSDDWYEPDTLQKAAEAYAKTNFEVLFATLRIHKGAVTVLKKPRIRRFITSRDWNHPTMFVAKAVYNEEKYALLSIYDDFEFYLRMRRQNRRIVTIDDILSNFAIGGISTKNSWAAVFKDTRARYGCYRNNGYSRLYILESAAQEIGKKLWAD